MSEQETRNRVSVVGRCDCRWEMCLSLEEKWVSRRGGCATPCPLLYPCALCKAAPPHRLVGGNYDSCAAAPPPSRKPWPLKDPRWKFPSRRGWSSPSRCLRMKVYLLTCQ